MKELLNASFFKELLVRSRSKTRLLSVEDNAMDYFLAYFLFSGLIFSALVLFHRAKHAYKRKVGFWLSLEMPIRVLKFFLQKKKKTILKPETEKMLFQKELKSCEMW